MKLTVGVMMVDDRETMIYFVDVKNCAACGNDHMEIIAHELFTIVEIDNKDYHYMYYCPDTGESMYLSKEEV